MKVLSRIDSRITSLLLPCLLMAVPVAVYWNAIFAYKANVPWRDDFRGVLLFLNQYVQTGSVWEKFGLIVMQHNEHRIVVARSVFLGYYLLFHKVNFDFFIIFGNLGWLLCIVALLAYIHHKYAVSLWYLVPLPFLLFSFQLSDPMFFTMSGIPAFWTLLVCILFFISLVERKLIWACILGIIALFSWGAGAVAIPVGAIYLIFNKEWKALAVLSGVGAVAIALYFTNYTLNDSEGIAQALSEPLASIRFILLFLGGSNPSLSPIYSGSIALPLGILLLGAAIFFVVKRRSIDFLALLVGLAVAIAILASLTRGDMGGQRALIARYALFSMMLFVAVYVYTVISIGRVSFARIFAILISLILVANWFNQLNRMQFSRKLYWQRKFRLTGVAVYVTDGVTSGLNLGKNTDEDHARGVAILDESRRLGIYDPQVAVDALNRK